MVRSHHLDLDLLDSPLISPTPLTSVGGIPGSAIAERIFNDPDSWETSSEQDEDNDPEMVWFADQLEKLKRFSAVADERKTIASLERGDLILHAFQDRQRTLQSQDDEAPKLGTEQSERPTQTEPRKAKLGKKSQRFSKNWEVRPPPSPLTLSPPSSGDEFIDIQFSAASSATIPSSKVASASATWSFLEWCGIQPGSPHVQSAVVESRQFRPRGLLQAPMTSQFPSQPPTLPPNLPLPALPPQSALPPDSVKTSSMIRRLPAVPASADPSKAACASLTVPRASLPDTSLREVPYTASRSFSEQWASLPSAMALASSMRSPLSVRSPPPAGPRPKGFGQRGRDSSQSPHRTVAPRPPALKL